MIISRTPLRVSFAGGGTDLKAFYEFEPGTVTSTAINKYVYIAVNKKFDEKIRVSYSQTEIVNTVDDVRHDLVREAMRLTGVTKGIEITSIADIPSAGSGLGSSSSFTVGLLNALYAYRGEHKSPEALAQEACQIEINIVGEPIGKQDQYIAAYGGFKCIQFNPDESVFVDPIICSKETLKELEGNLMMFYTGLTRKSGTILAEQRKDSKNRLEMLRQMKSFAEELCDCIRANGSLDKFGAILHRNWNLKKQLANGISNSLIDHYYQKALDAGALGGKILGAGGGGFLLLYCEKENQYRAREALTELKQTPFKFEPQGSKIIFIGD